MQTCMWSVVDSALASVDLSPLLIRSIPGPGSVLGPQPAPQHCCQLITRLPWRALQGLCRVSEVPAPSRQWGQDCVSCGSPSVLSQHVPCASSDVLQSCCKKNAILYHYHSFRLGEGEGGSCWASAGAAHPLQSGVYTGLSKAGLCSLVSSYAFFNLRTCT